MEIAPSSKFGPENPDSHLSVTRLGSREQVQFELLISTL